MTDQNTHPVPPTDAKAGDRFALEIFGVEYAFRYCPPGTFWMGCPETELQRWARHETQRKVEIPQGFWLLETPTTNAMWNSANVEPVKEADAFELQRRIAEAFRQIGAVKTEPKKSVAPDWPIDDVSGRACEAFLGKLQKFAPSGWRFALPSEAQWEYACRAGTKTPYSFGSSLNGVEANCNGECPYGTEEKGPNLKRPTPVRSYPPNAWGFYDMHGNVWERCSDLRSGEYRDEYGGLKYTEWVCRGGSWNVVASSCRSYDRSFCSDAGPGARGTGFRVALVSLTRKKW